MSWQSWVLVLAIGQAGDAALTAKQQSDLAAAVSEFRQGNYLAATQRLAPLLASEEVLAIVDDELRRQELPAVGEFMARARLEAAHDGQAAKMPRPAVPELVVLLPACGELLREEMDGLLGQSVMGDVLPAPAKLEGFADVFRRLDAAERRIEKLSRAAGYLRTLIRGIAQADLEKLPVDVRALAENDELAALTSSLELLQQGVEERRVELSIGRLAMAAGELAEPQLTTRQLAAAAVWNADLQRATAYLKKPPSKGLLRPALKEEGLLKRLSTQRDKVRRMAGPLTAKAGLLHDGLEWWRRGRFGIGPEAMGLAKNPQAVRTPDGRFLLYLPEKLRVHDPFEKPSGKNPFPFYPRRHLYTWAWNNRYLHTAGWTYERHFPTNSDSGSARSRGTISRASLSTSLSADEWARTLRRWLAENENENLFRLVGYLEYGFAVARFEELLRTATDAELAVMDQWVKDQPELAIHINLSRKFSQVATTAFAEWPQGPADDFTRHGLDWVIALARIELSAMRAAFANDRDAFQAVRPSNYESRAYEELLLDSLRLHLWGLQADPLFNERNLRKAVAGNDALAAVYERRTRLALAFIEAARQWQGPRLTQAQASELQQYGERLAELHGMIRRDLLRSDSPRGGDKTKADRKLPSSGLSKDPAKASSSPKAPE